MHNALQEEKHKSVIIKLSLWEELAIVKTCSKAQCENTVNPLLSDPGGLFEVCVCVCVWGGLFHLAKTV